MPDLAVAPYLEIRIRDASCENGGSSKARRFCLREGMQVAANLFTLQRSKRHDYGAAAKDTPVLWWVATAASKGVAVSFWSS
jgi:hypothetical protein